MFKKGDKIFLIILGIEIIIFDMAQMGLLQNVEYYLYTRNERKYSVITANIQEMHEIKRSGRYSVFQWKWTDIIYEYENQNYSIAIHSYPELTDEKEIQIAVKRSEPQKVLRCIPYTLTKKDKIKIMVGLGFILCVIMAVVIKNKIKEKRSEININLSQEKISKEDVERSQIERKKEYLFSCVKDVKEVACDEELIYKLGTSVNEDFIWCLKNLSKTCVADSILLLNISENKEYEFVAETIKLRQRGLPKQYYVIAKVENNYLCGRADMDRLYCFSYSLGITNTSYATIYDYIIEQIDKR